MTSDDFSLDMAVDLQDPPSLTVSNMALRDHLALQFAVSLMPFGFADWDEATMARRAYRYADAMLAERERGSLA